MYDEDEKEAGAKDVCGGMEIGAGRDERAQVQVRWAKEKKFPRPITAESGLCSR